eukprot:XP_011664999.1 PREDICTED: E3 ubiquitin-protein ligase TRIM50-like [Strongylocentrotus purpuratus]
MAKKVELVQLPESMECPLCLATFKAPTLLRCGHTFCKVCLDKYDEQHRDQESMECPFCKKRTKLGRNRVAGLAPNFSVNGIKEDLKGNGKSAVFCSLHKRGFAMMKIFKTKNKPPSLDPVPENTPEALVTVMTDSWSYDANDRPNFGG